MNILYREARRVDYLCTIWTFHQGKEVISIFILVRLLAYFTNSRQWKSWLEKGEENIHVTKWNTPYSTMVYFPKLWLWTETDHFWFVAKEANIRYLAPVFAVKGKLLGSPFFFLKGMLQHFKYIFIKQLLGFATCYRFFLFILQ